MAGQCVLRVTDVLEALVNDESSAPPTPAAPCHHPLLRHAYPHLAVGDTRGVGVYGRVYAATWVWSDEEERAARVLGLAAVPAARHFALKVVSARTRDGDNEIDADEAAEDPASCGGRAHYGPQLLRELMVAMTPHPRAQWLTVLAPPHSSPLTWAFSMPLGHGDLENTLGWSAWTHAFSAGVTVLRAVALPPPSSPSAAPSLLPESLATALARMTTRAPVPMRVVRWVFAQLAVQLAHLHGAGVVHRDVKPANVIVNWRGVAAARHGGAPPCPACARLLGCDRERAAERVADAAPLTATLVDGSLATSATPSLERDVVTLWWRAPELLVCAAHAVGECAACPLRLHGPAVDVWALGVMVLSAVVGRNVSVASTPAAVFADCFTALPSLLDEVRPLTLQTLLRGMLQVDPARRLRASDVVDHAWWFDDDAAAPLDAASAGALHALALRCVSTAAAPPRTPMRILHAMPPLLQQQPTADAPCTTRRHLRFVHRLLAAPLLVSASVHMAPRSRSAYRVAFTALALWDALATAPASPSGGSDVEAAVRRAAAVLAAAVAVAGDVMMPPSVQHGYLRLAAAATRASPDVVAAVAALSADDAVVDALQLLAAAREGGVRALCPRVATADCGAAVTFFPFALRMLDAACVAQPDQLRVFAAVAEAAATSHATAWVATPLPQPQSCGCCGTYRAYAGVLRGAATALLTPLEAAHVAASLPHACRCDEAADPWSPTVWALRLAATASSDGVHEWA